MAIKCVYSINWLVFVTEMECVYCAAHTKYLNLIQDNFLSQRVSLLDIAKSNIFGSVKQCYVAASKYSWNHFISEI